MIISVYYLMQFVFEFIKTNIMITVSSLVVQLTAKNVHCDISAVDKEFRTPLHWAAALDLSEVIGLLMERGANPTITDGTGATALRYAVRLTTVFSLIII